MLNLEVSRVDVPGGLLSGVVETLTGSGWELASHSLTHPDLTRVSAGRLKREIARLALGAAARVSACP